MTDAAWASSPWSGKHARSILLLLGGGCALVVWAWASARDAGSPPDQVGQLVVAIAGFGAVIVGAIYWIGTGRGVLGRRNTDVLGRLADLLPSTDPGEPLESATVADAGAALVALVGSSRYHRPDCLLIRGKPVERGPVETGRTPCEMCTP